MAEPRTPRHRRPEPGPPPHKRPDPLPLGQGSAPPIPVWPLDSCRPQSQTPDPSPGLHLASWRELSSALQNSAASQTTRVGCFRTWKGTHARRRTACDAASQPRPSEPQPGPAPRARAVGGASQAPQGTAHSVALRAACLEIAILKSASCCLFTCRNLPQVQSCNQGSSPGCALCPSSLFPTNSLRILLHLKAFPDLFPPLRTGTRLGSHSCTGRSIYAPDTKPRSKSQTLN